MGWLRCFFHPRRAWRESEEREKAIAALEEKVTALTAENASLQEETGRCHDEIDRLTQYLSSHEDMERRMREVEEMVMKMGELREDYQKRIKRYKEKIIALKEELRSKSIPSQYHSIDMTATPQQAAPNDGHMPPKRTTDEFPPKVPRRSEVVQDEIPFDDPETLTPKPIPANHRGKKGSVYHKHHPKSATPPVSTQEDDDSNWLKLP